MAVTIQHIGTPTNAKSIGEWVKAHTEKVAMDALRQEVGRGFDNQPVVVTDGVPRRDPAQVKPFGKIEFIRRPQMAEAVLWALDMLRKRSPVLTGQYVQSHVVLLNDAELQGDLKTALASVKDGDRVQIVNNQPYARKIEGATARKAAKTGSAVMRAGRQKRAASSKMAKNGVYRPVMRLLVQRYGRSMFFDFSYVKLNLGVKVMGKQGGGSGKKVLRDQVYPSINLFIKPTGLPN